MNETQNQQTENYLRQVQVAAERLVLMGWDPAQGGNLSLITPEPPHGWHHQGYLLHTSPVPLWQYGGLLTTISGSRWRETVSDPIGSTTYIHLAMKPPELWRKPGLPERKPTSELNTHLSLHLQRMERGMVNGVVLHAHPPALLALSLLPVTQCTYVLKQLPRMFPEAALTLGKGIQFVPDHSPGSYELQHDTVNSFTISNIALWHKHGVIIAADNVDHVLDILETAEAAAAAYWKFLSAGIKPDVLSDGELDELTNTHCNCM